MVSCQELADFSVRTEKMSVNAMMIDVVAVTAVYIITSSRSRRVGGTMRQGPEAFPCGWREGGRPTGGA